MLAKFGSPKARILQTLTLNFLSKKNVLGLNKILFHTQNKFWQIFFDNFFFSLKWLAQNSFTPTCFVSKILLNLKFLWTVFAYVW